MKKFIICSLFLLRCWADDSIVAWVEGEIITQKELDYLLKEGMDKDEALDEMINLVLFEKHASKLGISVSSEMVSQRIKEIKEQFRDISLFNIALAEKGMDEASFCKMIKAELTKVKFINLLNERIRIKEDEVISSFSKWQEEVNVAFWEAKEQKDAERIFFELTKYGTGGEKIETSGFFCFPEMQEAFSKMAFALPKGEISHPFKVKDKFYIIKVIERRETEPNHLAKIRDELFLEQTGVKREKTPNENREDILAEILSLIEIELKNKKKEAYLKEFLNEARESAYLKIIDG